MKKTTFPPGLVMLVLVLTAAVAVSSRPVLAQDPPERQIRGFIPPDQLVSFRPETPFAQFLDFLNPIFERVNNKMVIDPESRSMAIGVSVSSAHYFDAFELVLQYNGLTYRETDRYFIVEEAPDDLNVMVNAPGAALAATELIPATLDTREIVISAVLFAYNKTKAKDIGIDWNVFFGGETSSGSRSGGGAGGAVTGATTGTGTTGTTGTAGTQVNTIPQFFLRTDNLADAVDQILVMPDVFNVSVLTQFFRFLETEGVGETVANPSVTVQSGEQGRIQIGTDFPFVTRDFSGNTITNFVSTGIIIDVTPTLISEAVVDTTGAPEIDFIHLNVRVENSNGQITPAGPLIDRSTANTQVLLLDGEQTVIGGLYTTDERVNRRGIPILKDLPGWVFGLRYLTGVTQRTQIQQELVILLKADLVDRVRDRVGRPFESNLLEQRRRQVEEALQGLSQTCAAEFEGECPITKEQ